MSPRTFLVLGRVSNLPTVWTNALAGLALSGTAIGMGLADGLAVILSLTLAYVGGMYLNDAFDAKIDAAERSNRPIPTGQITQGTVFILGLAFLAAAVALGFRFGVAAGLVSVALAGMIVLYDWLHKRTVFGPVFMGACRALSVIFAAQAAGAVPEVAWLAAAGLFAHTVGLTYAAKQEAYDRIDRLWPMAIMAVPILIGLWMVMTTLVPGPIGWVCCIAYIAWSLWCLRRLVRRAPGDVPKGVVGLIAGIALYDAVALASVGAGLAAILAVGLFGLTLALQRIVPGT